MDEISGYEDLIVNKHNFHDMYIVLIQPCMTIGLGALVPRLFTLLLLLM